MNNIRYKIVTNRAAVPKGSLSVGVSRTGKPFVRESAGDALRAFMAELGFMARSARGNNEIITGPVQVWVKVTLQRPKGHYGTGKNEGQLKVSAPPHHTQWPDVDKLARGVLDALTGVVWRDDSQVTSLHIGKEWGDEPRTSVTVIEP